MWFHHIFNKYNIDLSLPQDFIMIKIFILLTSFLQIHINLVLEINHTPYLPGSFVNNLPFTPACTFRFYSVK